MLGGSFYGGDANLCGTSLDYLQTTLPDGLRAALRPHIPSAKGVKAPPQRSRQQIAEELMKTSPSLRLSEES